MPELPEVETVRQIIEPQLSGQKIVSVEINNPQIIAHPGAEEFRQLLLNQTIEGMSRRGKFLNIHFIGGGRLTLHLRMTGQLLVTPGDWPQEKHTHLVAGLANGSQLRYIDVRRFGRFWYIKNGEEDTLTGQARLGAEPLGDGVTAEYLRGRLGGSGKPIKEMLHDQTVVAGIGNIYSDEILFAASLYPGTKCKELTAQDWVRLAEKIPEIIAWGIETNSMTAQEYLAGKGKEYRNTPCLRAYGRAGQPCTRCGAVMEKTVIGGRSSCYCPACQPKRP